MHFHLVEWPCLSFIIQQGWWWKGGVGASVIDPISLDSSDTYANDKVQVGQHVYPSAYK